MAHAWQALPCFHRVTARRLLRHLLLGHGLGWSERGTGESTVCVSLFSSLPLLSRQNIYVLQQRRKRKRFKFICIVCMALFGRQCSASEGWAVLAPDCLTAARARVLPRLRWLAIVAYCGLLCGLLSCGVATELAFVPVVCSPTLLLFVFFRSLKARPALRTYTR